MVESDGPSAAGSAESPEHQLPVGPDTRVVFTYVLRDADGEVVESATSQEDAVEFLFGYAQAAPRLEQALEGAWPGQTRSVELPAQEAFGRRDPERVVEVDRDDFPPNVAAGDEFDAESEGGELLPVRVLDVQDDVVVLDTNHPLADQSVTLELKVEDVWVATSEEIAEAVQAIEAGDPEQLISTGSLIRPRSQGYESQFEATPEPDAD